MVESEATATPEPPSKEELRLAMKAFRKRLKLTRLDDESRMGYGARPVKKLERRVDSEKWLAHGV